MAGKLWNKCYSNVTKHMRLCKSYTSAAPNCKAAVSGCRMRGLSSVRCIIMQYRPRLCAFVSRMITERLVLALCGSFGVEPLNSKRLSHSWKGGSRIIRVFETRGGLVSRTLLVFFSFFLPFFSLSAVALIRLTSLHIAPFNHRGSTRSMAFDRRGELPYYDRK